MADEYAPLAPPESIDDTSVRALVGLLARWDELETERVLVWHLDTVIEEALPHVADTLGLLDVRWVTAAPRDFLAEAVAFMRRRGTPGALKAAIASLGYEPALTQVYEDTVWRHDGSFTHAGEPIRHGGDAHWSVLIVALGAASLPTVEEAREAWDTVEFMSREVNRVVLAFFDAADTALVYREAP